MSAPGDAAHGVRPATPGDLAELVAMCAEHARFERCGYDPAGKAERLGTALFGTPVRLRAWVACAAGQVVGYASVTEDFSTWDARAFLYLDCLYVREGWRDAGLGAQLMQAVLAHARARDIDQVQWQTPDWNEDACRFYRRQGGIDSAKRRFSLRVR